MKVAAIIPAYNEENTIVEVVSVVKKVPLISEVIVVSDGSRDNTVVRAREAGAKVLELTLNQGKGGAMMWGLQNTDAEIILFLDADLLGLQPFHVLSLLAPVLSGEAQMTIGIFDHGRLATDMAQFIAPYLSGQRVVRRNVLEQISNLAMARFGVEVALTKFAKIEGISIVEVELTDMSHIMKEEKLGLIKGLLARMKMYWEIAKVVGNR